MLLTLVILSSFNYYAVAFNWPTNPLGQILQNWSSSRSRQEIIKNRIKDCASETAIIDESLDLKSNILTLINTNHWLARMWLPFIINVPAKDLGVLGDLQPYLQTMKSDTINIDINLGVLSLSKNNALLLSAIKVEKNELYGIVRNEMKAALLPPGVTPLFDERLQLWSDIFDLALHDVDQLLDAMEHPIDSKMETFDCACSVLEQLTVMEGLCKLDCQERAQLPPSVADEEKRAIYTGFIENGETKIVVLTFSWESNDNNESPTQ